MAPIALLDEAHEPAALALFQALGYDATMNARTFAHLTRGDPTSSPELRLMATADGELVGFAIGCVRDQALVIKYVAVHPNHQRCGIATALVNRLEAQARQLGLERALAGGVGPNFFYPGVDVRLAPALSLFWRLGYETDRVARVDMRVELGRAPLDVRRAVDALAEQGIAVRRIAREDLAAVADFGGVQSEAWRTEVLEAGANEPITGFAAFADGQPVSFAVYGVTGPHRFGPTLTHPDYRQRGIGGTLLKLCLAALRDDGWPEAEISWAGPVHYYIRAVGAAIHKAYWVFTKTLVEVPADLDRS